MPLILSILWSRRGLIFEVVRVLNVAKFLQALALAVVGYALMVGLTEEKSMGKELYLLGAGVVVFYLGRVMEERATA